MQRPARTLLAAALLVAIATVLGLAWNPVNPRGIALRPPAPAPGANGRAVASEHFFDAATALAPAERISVDRAHEIWRDGVVLAIDSRSAAEFEAMHIPGARNISAGPGVFARDLARHHQWLTQKLPPTLASEYPAGVPVIVYCDNPYCDQGVTTFRLLRNSPLGLKNLRLMTEGLDGWKKKGLPVAVPVRGPDGKPVREADGAIRTELRAGADIPRLADTGRSWLPPGVLFALVLTLPWALLAALAGAVRRGPRVLAASIDGASLLLRLGLGALFLIAAGFKLADPAGFARMVACYELLPVGLVAPFSVALPAVEALSGLLLVAGFATRPAALVLAGLLVVFLVAVFSLLVRNLSCVCGCFPGEYPVSWMRLFEDAAFLAAALLVVWRGGGRFALDRWRRSGRPAPPRAGAASRA